jgi:enamine deaminase RidA (YjgF/YER057c/UK114 family)
MPRFLNPRKIARPASHYSHGVVHSARARRLIVSGQLGIRPDGTVPDTLENQLEVAFDNIFAVVLDGGMGVTDIVQIRVYVTVPDAVKIYRKVRDTKLGGHAPTATFLQIAGLAAPMFLCEVEAEAVSEEPDLLFDEIPDADMVVPASTVRRSRG